MDREEHLMPLRIIMATISDECRELGVFVDRFQHTLSPALAHLRLEEQSHQDVQLLDSLSQRLAALAVYIKEISNILPGEFHVDASNALASVSVSDLQRRLKGLSMPLVQDHSSGELELF